MDAEDFTRKFLLEDYKLKVQYLTDHFSRMWTRFNFFLTINSALLAFSVQKDTADFAPLFVVVGVLLSALWYFFGATDNYLVEVYRKQIGYAYSLLNVEVPPQSESNEEALKYYSHVGEIKEDLPIDENLLQWRYTLQMRYRWKGEWREGKWPISATELAVVLPVVFFLLWIVRLSAS